MGIRIAIIILLMAVYSYGADSVVTVAPADEDYTTVEAALDDNEQDLTSLAKRMVIQITGDWSGGEDTDGVTTAGYTNPTSDYYIYIYTDSEARHDGKWNANKYILKYAFIAIFNSVDYTRIEGLQINHTANDADRYGILSTSANVTIAYCIIKATEAPSANLRGIVTTGAGGEKYIYNTIIYDYSVENFGIAMVIGGCDSCLFVYNNTMINCDLGISGSFDDVTAINNLFSGVVHRTNITQLAAGSDYNTTDSSSFEYSVDGGGNDHDSVDATITFEGAEDFHITSNQNTGSDLSGIFTDDIDGDTRSAWNRGADEFVGAPPEVEGRRRRLLQILGGN